MKRALKMIVPLVILVELVLVLSGIMELGDAILVVVGIEALLMLIGISGVILIFRRYRQERKAGLNPLKALEDSLSLLLPAAVARLITHEPRIFAALFRWSFRRTRLGEGEFSYHKRSLLRSLMPMMIFVLPVELFIVHLFVYLLTPWEWITWALLILEIYAFSWLLGLYASLITHPYSLEETGLRLHHGVFAEGSIPYSQIMDVAREESKAPSYSDGLQHSFADDALYLATSGKTDVVLALNEPTSLRGFIRDSKPASYVYLAADDPRGLASGILERTEALAASTVGDGYPAPGRDAVSRASYKKLVTLGGG